MNKRPSLTEALALLSTHISNVDCKHMLDTYNTLVSENKEFLAGRMVIETVHQYYLSTNTGLVSNG